jgi:hypothetical protein
MRARFIANLQSKVSPFLHSNSASFSFTTLLLDASRIAASTKVAAVHTPIGTAMLIQTQNADGNRNKTLSQLPSNAGGAFAGGGGGGGGALWLQRGHTHVPGKNCVQTQQLSANFLSLSFGVLSLT